MEGTTSVVSAILEVVLLILGWFVDAVTEMTALFYTAEAGLTVIGTITVIGFGIALVLLVAAWIRSLFRAK